jgi:transcriptional regulator with XRE-family HTH domain
VRYLYICAVNNLFPHNMTFSERLKKARLAKGYSKSDLAKEINVHYSQIGRYEEKGAQPSADVLGKLANALEVTSDFLMNGTSDDMANNSLTDKELLNQFKIIEKLPEKDKDVVKVLLDAFITKGRLRQLAI